MNPFAMFALRIQEESAVAVANCASLVDSQSIETDGWTVSWFAFDNGSQFYCVGKGECCGLKNCDLLTRYAGGCA